jgi:hypothetical protein
MKEKKMKLKPIISAVMVTTALLSTLYGCQKPEGPAEKAGQKIDKAVEKAGEKIDQTKEKVGEKVEKAGEKIQDSGNSADKK